MSTIQKTEVMARTTVAQAPSAGAWVSKCGLPAIKFEFEYKFEFESYKSTKCNLTSD
jgi:hypothetical protein